jgi:hypothetical protein
MVFPLDGQTEIRHFWSRKAKSRWQGQRLDVYASFGAIF